MTALARARSQADDDLLMWERLTARLHAPPSNVARLPRRTVIAAHDFECPPISDDDREDYQVELMEAAGRLMDADERLFENPAEADRIAVLDLGCVEFWQYAREVNAYCDAKRAYVSNFDRFDT
jgi:hypothetical protein